MATPSVRKKLKTNKTITHKNSKISTQGFQRSIKMLVDWSNLEDDLIQSLHHLIYAYILNFTIFNYAMVTYTSQPTIVF